jgi:AbrB family transcriptional regulator, stage V sporulation protein T
MTYHAKVIAGGKIVIPADLRRELGIATGDSLVIERGEGGLVLKSFRETVRAAQEEYRAMVRPFTVDEFIAERRAEAERE